MVDEMDSTQLKIDITNSISTIRRDGVISHDAYKRTNSFIYDYISLENAGPMVGAQTLHGRREPYIKADELAAWTRRLEQLRTVEHSAFNVTRLRTSSIMSITSTVSARSVGRCSDQDGRYDVV